MTKHILEQYEDIKVGIIGGEGAHRILLIMFVMTLHSVSEGIGIGVSFGKLIYSLLKLFLIYFRWCTWISIRKIYFFIISNT